MVRFSIFAALALVVLMALLAGSSPAKNRLFPSPAVDSPKASQSGKQTMVVAGGCFWGIQAVFQHVKGVTNATSGYSGGQANTAEYELVSSGQTGHAESVKVTYDPSEITYGELLKIFFSMLRKGHTQRLEE